MKQLFVFDLMQENSEQFYGLSPKEKEVNHHSHFIVCAKVLL